MYRARGLRVRGRGGRLGEGADGWTSCVKSGCDYSGRIWRVWGRGAAGGALGCDGDVHDVVCWGTRRWGRGEDAEVWSSAWTLG
jgi:hypothetical protein